MAERNLIWPLLTGRSVAGTGRAPKGESLVEVYRAEWCQLREFNEEERLSPESHQKTKATPPKVTTKTKNDQSADTANGSISLF